MKKFVYVGLFALLGVLFMTLIHGVVEVQVLRIITSDLATYGESFIWRNWTMVHGLLAGALWIKGALFGVWLGLLYWRIIYVEKRYGTPRL
jgi:mannose/fructose/N-acetylgalactosamine-specific phosphotransferase system component IID